MEKTKRVKISENKLREIIKESVRKTLNELDPRTYASYAQKRSAQKPKAYDPKSLNNHYGSIDTAEKMAVDAWNKKYGYDEKIQHGNNNPGYQKRNMVGSDKDGKYSVYSDSMNSSPYWKTPQQDANVDNQANNFNNKVDDGSIVARQMANGTGTYKDGKWLQESHIKKIGKNSKKKL